jgi:hypothetical protein
MPDEQGEGLHGGCPAETTLAREFPDLYAFFSAHPASRPERNEHLHVARHCKPILADLRACGLDLVRIDQYTPPGTDRRPLYQTVLDWLPRIQDPLTLTICLARLTEPGARLFVKKRRQLLLGVAREWNERLRQDDRENTLAVLAQCVMKAIVESDLPEVLGWAKDSRLRSEVRFHYALDLQSFARKPGVARNALLNLVKEEGVGNAAVWALAKALKAEALPLLRELRESSPHDSVRDAASVVIKKIEARSRRIHLRNASPAMLPPI